VEVEPGERGAVICAVMRWARSASRPRAAMSSSSKRAARRRAGAGLRAPVDSRRVAAPSATQLAWRGRIEALLRVAGPALDLLLLAGDRISRAVDRDADDEAPPAVAVAAAAAPPAVGPGPVNG
jgi:hypothetical protein